MRPGFTSSLFNFKSLYIVFVIAVLFYGPVRLLYGLTPRHVAIVVMLIACMRQGVPFPMGRIVKAYLVFILSYLISATITGYIGSVLITYYVAACVGFWATKILVVKYHYGKLLFNILVITGVLDAIVTIGQTFGMLFSDQLVSLFHVTLPEKYLDMMNEGVYEDQFLLLVRPGLFANLVYNGYFLMTAGVISLSLLAHKFNIQRLIPWLVILVGCICVQERGPIVILTFLSALVFFKILIIKRNTYLLFILVFGLLAYFLTGKIASMLPDQGMDSATHTTISAFYEDNESSSYSQNDFLRLAKESRFANTGLDDPYRIYIYGQSIDYIMDHPFIGGLHRLNAMYDIYPHNLLLNAFIYGGIVGGVAILLILFWQIKPLWRVLRNKIADTNTVCFFAGLAYLANTLNSLTHNISIVSGDEMIWMLWAAFYFEYRKFYQQDVRL